MTRRDVLRLLGVTAAALAADPERRLWIPGQRKIFIPSPAIVDLGVLSIRNALEAFAAMRSDRGATVLIEPKYIYIGTAGIYQIDRSGIHPISRSL